MSHNRQCMICGKTYSYCPACHADSTKPRWMVSFDDEKCKKIWDILSANGAGDIDNATALAQLKALNYKAIAITNDAVLKHIAKLEGKIIEQPKEAEKEPVKEVIKETKKDEAPIDNTTKDETLKAIRSFDKNLKGFGKK